MACIMSGVSCRQVLNCRSFQKLVLPLVPLANLFSERKDNRENKNASLVETAPKFKATQEKKPILMF